MFLLLLWVYVHTEQAEKYAGLQGSIPVVVQHILQLPAIE